jgi:hypothetical protein
MNWMANVIGKRLKIARVTAGMTQATLGVNAAWKRNPQAPVLAHTKRASMPRFYISLQAGGGTDVPEAYFYAVDDDLAELILQYHRFKKNNPGKMVLIGPN